MRVLRGAFIIAFGAWPWTHEIVQKYLRYLDGWVTLRGRMLRDLTSHSSRPATRSGSHPVGVVPRLLVYFIF